MPGKVVISALNQYRFVPQNDALPVNYNNRPYKSTLFRDTKKYWQIDTRYLQKVQTADWMRIQIWTGYDTSPVTEDIGKMYLRLYTCRGVEIGDPLEIPRLGSVTAFPDSEGDLLYVNGIALKTYWADRMSLAGVDEGEFHFILEVPYTDTDIEEPGIDYFISEPIHVKAKHPKTMLAEISSSVNRDNCIFQQVFWKWNFRIEGTILPPVPQVDRVVFKDQGSNTKQLSATVYNKPVLSVGYNKPVPMWCIEKMNHYLACNNIYIDTVGYTTIEGSQLALEQPDNNFPFYQGNMDLGDKDNNQNFEFDKRYIVLIRNIPEDPFFIRDLQLGMDSVNTAFYHQYNVRIGDDADLSVWIDIGNAALIDEGFESTIAKIDNNLVLIPAIADLINFGKVNVLYNRLGILMTTTAPVEAINLTLILGAVMPNYVAVCLPDGSTGITGTVTSSTITLTTPSYPSPAGGVYIFELFHDGENLTEIDIDSTKISGLQDFGVPDNVPPRLRTFGIHHSTKLTSFNAYTVFENCRNYLYALQLNNNPALADVNLYTPVIGIPAAPGWGVLGVILLNNNAIPVTGIDAIYNDTKAAHLALQWGVYNGSIITSNQSPAAVPTVASADARHILGPTSTGGTYNWLIIATP